MSSAYNSNSNTRPYTIIIVDDDQQTHEITKFALKNITFKGQELSFLHAFSAEEAKQKLSQQNNIALILLDVSMEKELSGYELITCIREELKNHLIRIVLRTGQTGYAPSPETIEKFDIHAYKEKTELTRMQVITTIISALNVYDKLSQSHQA